MEGITGFDIGVILFCALVLALGAIDSKINR